MMKNRFRFLLVLVVMFVPGALKSQVLVESVAAIVGNEVIYLSDVENTLADIRRSGSKVPVDQLRCNVFKEMLTQKLFVDQARIDSVIIADDAVEGELNMRLNEFIKTAGSEESLVAYFKKSMFEIRRDVKKNLMEQETVREMQSKIAKDITITPSALKRYFATIPKDSLPVIPAMYQISLVQLDPPSNEDNKAEARQRLLDLRSRILKGENFSVLARLYSEDTESAKNGGEVGFLTRGQLEKEYADVAFSLTKNTVSRIVETKYGFHIIQLIERKGDMVNTRHILVRPKVKPDQAARAMAKLDSIATQIRIDSITFEKAALRYSTHKDSRINGGKLVSTNPNDRITWFTLEELNPEMYMRVREMKIGQISEPFKTTDDSNNEVFRIIRLDNILQAHTANLKDDYQSIYNSALNQERSKVFEKWINDKIKNTYIRIGEEFRSCEFLKNGGWLK